MTETSISDSFDTSNSFNQTEETIDCISEDEKSEERATNSLPKKSKRRYNLIYQVFMEWCLSENIKQYTEDVILKYLLELSQKYKPSTLWSTYSMLKATLANKHNIDIGCYRKVTNFLKKQSFGHTVKKSKVFTHEEINKFLREAPDETYLLAKVILIIGTAGGCRTVELTNMTIDNVIDKDNLLILNIMDSRDNRERTFAICNSEQRNSIDVVSICRKYFKLRPRNMPSRRLFIKYSNGRCAAQNVGHNTIGALPSKIAGYLKLPNHTDYTGHCFRKTSVSMLANSRANLFMPIGRSGEKSTNIAAYVDTSFQNEKTRDETNYIESSCSRKDSLGGTEFSENNEFFDLLQQAQSSGDPLVIKSELEEQDEINEIQTDYCIATPFRIESDRRTDKDHIDNNFRIDEMSCASCPILSTEIETLKTEVQRLNSVVRDLRQELLQSKTKEIKLEQIVRGVKEIVNENIHIPIVYMKQET